MWRREGRKDVPRIEYTCESQSIAKMGNVEILNVCCNDTAEMRGGWQSESTGYGRYAKDIEIGQNHKDSDMLRNLDYIIK